jgi:hypothetical protein
VENVWVLIPLMALSIPLAAVVGRVVIKPVVDAITQLSGAQAAAGRTTPQFEQRLAATEERLAGIERLLEKVVDEQDFQRKLMAGRQPPSSPGLGTPTSTRELTPP